MIDYTKTVDLKRKGEKEPNEKIIKLGKKITDVIKHKLGNVTSEDAEYWGLADIVSDEMADVALKMDVRHPYTVPELHKMCEVKEEDYEKFQKLLDQMAYIGLLEYDYGYHYNHEGRTAEPSERRYILPRFVPGSAELLNMDEDENGVNNRLKEHPELAPFFERMTYVPLEGVTQMVPPGGAGVGMHVIPVEKAISMQNEAIDLEKLSYWLKKYEGHIGVGQCSCRASRGLMGEGVGDDPLAWCIGVGDFADYCRETGKGHDISYEEAMAILTRAEENGFVHQITNIDGENKIFGICNCNVNICNALRTSQLFNTPNMSRSAYTAKVDPDKCVACGKCVAYCPAGAVKLGQRLNTKYGPVIYPWHELPDAKKWGKEKYDYEYRDTNRINCYDTGTAPCKAACPAHVPVQAYLRKAKEGKFTEALGIIKSENPFPAICGRVCNKRCEQACTRGTIDSPVAIDDVKKYLAERDLHAETRFVPPVVVPISPARIVPKDRFTEKIAIIGGGPAGLSCAYYLATMGYTPTVFEKNERLGGMMTYGIPSFKLEKDVIEAEIDVLRELGVEFRTGVNVGTDVTIPQLREQGYKAFYIAIGCQGGRLPGVENEDAEGVIVAVDFLHKVTESNLKGTELKLEGKVVVLGGGNVAVDCARDAVRLGASKVSMFSLEDADSMPATKDEIRESVGEDIEVNNSWGIKEIHVDENHHIKEIVMKRCTRTIDPETKRFSPAYDENTTCVVEADHLILAIGQATIWGDLLKGTNVELERGRVKADKLTYQTTDPDIFVGGDVFTGPSFVINAIAQGHEVCESLHRFVQPNASMTIGRNKREFIALDKSILAIDENSYDRAPRQLVGMDESFDHKHSFKDAHLIMTDEQVKTETSRCLSCGASVVDPHKCIGCGVCTTKCKFDAIHLFRDHPDATSPETMIKAEEKVKALLPYAAKRWVKIVFNAQPKEDKEHEKAYKEFRKAYEAGKAEEGNK